MNSKAKSGWLLLLGLAPVGFFLTQIFPDRSVSANSPKPLPDATNLQLHISHQYEIPKGLKTTGVTSCATASCHGAERGNTTEGSEHLIWASQDPHSKAYKILFNEVSVRMADNLNKSRPKDQQFPAHQDPVCLRCHGLFTEKLDRLNYTAFDKEPLDILKMDAVLSDGVSCEACHGAAEKWVSAHYEAGWKEKSLAEKAKLGLYPTKDLSFRVQLCASCHIGHVAGEDVNHDLYAAGHPRLAFEYTLFHNSKTLTRHWTEKAYGNDFEIRAWAIGQVASIRGEIELLRSRAESASAKKSPWPELSEYSCYACHHQFTYDKEKSRFDLDHGDRKPGQLPWATLYRPMMDVLAEEGATFSATGVPPDLKNYKALVSLMEPSKNSKANPFPEPQAVSNAAKGALAELDKWLLDLQRGADRDTRANTITPERIRKLMTKIADHNLTGTSREAKLKDADWEWVSQHYLSLTSLHYGTYALDPKAPSKDVGLQLQKMQKVLDFPRGYSSPIEYNPRQFPKLMIDLRSAIK